MGKRHHTQSWREKKRDESKLNLKDKYNCHCYLIQLDLDDSYSPNEQQKKNLFSA